MRVRMLFALFVCLAVVQPLIASDPRETGSAPADATSTSVTFPRLIRFGGTLPAEKDGVAGVTFALYSEQIGGAPLWQEVQNVHPDSSGHYTVLLGSSQAEGLPADLFASNRAQWLGIKPEGLDELPRVLLVSVPYALKAGDAETLGGRPLSAFVLNSIATGTNSNATATSGGSSVAKSFVSPRAALFPPPAQDYLPFFVDNTGTLGSSIVKQAGGVIGINTNFPSNAANTKLHVNGNIQLSGQSTHQLLMIGNGSQARFGEDLSGAFVASDTPNQSIRFLTRPPGETLTPQLSILSNGNVGIGTSTAASKLTVKGDVTASGVVNATAINASANFKLGGTPVLSASGDCNTQTCLNTQNVFVGIGAGIVNTSSSNSFVGHKAGFNNTTGSLNTFLGDSAGPSNTIGSANTFNGAASGDNNTTGNNNTFLGWEAGISNITGSNNTFVGGSTGYVSATGNNNTYVGYEAGGVNNGNYNVYLGTEAASNTYVTNENNAMRLGSEASDSSAITSTYIAGINGSTVNNGVPVYIDSTGKLGTIGGANATFGGAVSATSYQVGGAPVLVYDPNYDNVALGTGTSNTTGIDNVFTGYHAGFSNTNGIDNYFGGTFAGVYNSSGSNNVFVGDEAGNNNTSGSGNVFVGFLTGFFNNGSENTYVGDAAGSGTEGSNNIYLGSSVGGGSSESNTMRLGSMVPGIIANTFIAGINGATVTDGMPVYIDSTGKLGTAGGTNATFGGTVSATNYQIGGSNVLSSSIPVSPTLGGNTLVGLGGGSYVSTGYLDTFIGSYSGAANTTGYQNTFAGAEAGFDNLTGNNNTYFGALAGRLNNGSNNVYLGSNVGNDQSITAESNTMRLGSPATDGTGITTTYIAGLTGVQVSNGVGVVVDSNGHIGVASSSSRRFKDDIQPMGDVTEGLFKLRPVTFYYKRDFDRSSPRLLQYGLVAEELAEIYPELVTYDAEGRPNAIKYQYFAPMLLNELQKQHRVIARQQSLLESQQDEAQAQAERLRSLERQNRELQGRLERLEALVTSSQK